MSYASYVLDFKTPRLAFSGNIDWEINKHVSLGFSYSHFFAGQVIIEAGGHASDYVRTQLKLCFNNSKLYSGI